jgi:hypothetical protein
MKLVEQVTGASLRGKLDALRIALSTVSQSSQESHAVVAPKRVEFGVLTEKEASPEAGTVGEITGEGDPSPHAGHQDNATPDANADDVKIMKDAPDQQNAAPGAAEDSQGFGQHGDQDATDSESRQVHPKTPS